MLNSANVCIVFSILVYLIVVVGIGVACSRRNRTTDDFYLGGRKLGPLVTAMSAEASDMSSWLLMGLPGVAYLSGMADAGWTAIGLAVGTYLNWLIVARRIRLYTHRLGAITIPEFFSKRFGDEKRVLTGIAAVVILIFFIPYTASGFAACGKLFNSLFGVNYVTAMVVSGIVIVVYTSLGGFLAASTTDFIQSIVMTIALIVMVLFGIHAAGGLDVVMDNARALPGYLSMTLTHDMAENSASPYGFITIISTLAWGLGYFGMPHILLRFMAIEDERKLTLSRRVASIWVVISMAVAIFIGIVGYGVTKAGSIGFLADSASETVIVQLAGLLSTYGVFAALLAGVVLAGILASTMSTSDSQLLAAASSVSQNLMSECFQVKMDERKKVAAARLTVVAIALIAMFLARDPNSSVFGIVSFAWAGFGAAFGPVILFGLFWRRANWQGALAGMVSGGVTIFVWKYLIRPFGGAWNIYELLPAFLVACVFIVVVSLTTAEPRKEVVDTFNAVKAM
ncbi:sodium/proline symporter [Oscillibacter valericigenes Sjm18-20]|nr:sodium/proline symporter [Oscillibacter valericigenes Sjm18-20]